jgi:hypothetical protein
MPHNRHIRTKVKLRVEFVIKSTKQDIEEALRGGCMTISDFQSGGVEEVRLVSYEAVECDKNQITFNVQCYRPIGMDGSTDQTAKDSILETLKK